MKAKARTLTLLWVGAALALGGCTGGKNREKLSAVLGTVALEDGKPLSGATVFVDGTALQTATNAQGKYTLSGLLPGEQTVVAMKPGYLPAIRININIPEGKKVGGIDFVLKPDPSYVPDAVAITDITPPLDTVLKPGSEVAISFRVRYNLTSDKFGKVVVMLQDEKKNPLIPAPMSQEVTSKQGAVPFIRRFTVPQRIIGEIYIIAALFPGLLQTSEITDMAVYKVRGISDSLKIPIVLLRPLGQPAERRFALSANVNYALETLTGGSLRVQVWGDKGNGKFDLLLHETQQTVDKTQAASGTLPLTTTLTLAADVVAIRIKAELTPTGSKTPLLDATSQSQPVK